MTGIKMEITSLMYLFIYGGEGKAFTVRSYNIFFFTSMTTNNEIQA